MPANQHHTVNTNDSPQQHNSIATSTATMSTSGDREKCVLVTGGAGYIGSHATVELLRAGYRTIIVDNLCNSNIACIGCIEKIANKKIDFYKINLMDKPALQTVFDKHKIDYVVHFAGLKAVGESCSQPLLYYRNNLEGSMTLLEVMKANNVTNMVFSSSATVYGPPQYLPVDENHPIGGCTNPYGKTKYFTEEIMRDLTIADKSWNVICLRYFNPTGAHPSGEIGEDPMGYPNNLMPYMAQVAVGRREKLGVFGHDYDTHDGTGVRDYIHVVDLAHGHVAALNKLDENCGFKAYNLGTGVGYSVLDMVEAFRKASGAPIPYELQDRRPGDIDTCYGDPTLANKELGWTAKYGLDDMCRDVWTWQSSHPYGFGNPSNDTDTKTDATMESSVDGKTSKPIKSVSNGHATCSNGSDSLSNGAANNCHSNGVNGIS